MHRSIEQSESITKDLKKGKVERGSFGSVTYARHRPDKFSVECHRALASAKPIRFLRARVPKEAHLSSTLSCRQFDSKLTIIIEVNTD
jgi:hypothetical protein